MSKTSSYHDALVESLTDPVEAKHYLRAVLEDYPQGFLKALRNVAQANQMKKVAESAGIKRESLYRALSDQGNPTFDTLTGVLAALGFKLSVVGIDEEPTASASQAPSVASTETQQPIVLTYMFASTYVAPYNIQLEEPVGILGVGIPRPQPISIPKEIERTHVQIH